MEEEERRKQISSILTAGEGIDGILKAISLRFFGPIGFFYSMYFIWQKKIIVENESIAFSYNSKGLGVVSDLFMKAILTIPKVKKRLEKV